MRHSLLLFTAILLTGCNPEKKQSKEESQHSSKTETTFPEKGKSMTIYEVNIRQHTPEGTFKAFQEHLPKLKELGADILWIMPIQPIGNKNRKGSLGSYYSISDYKAVNPEFGTLEDFKALVKKAHDEGFYVILDWVPNHTAWDHIWIKEHPEFYMTDSAATIVGKTLGEKAGYYKKSGTGNLVFESDWNDIALLNLYNRGAASAMIDAMRFWITETDIDGFRADHAGHEIPLFFWEDATAALNPLKDLFWLAEWDEPRMHLTFDATYDWTLLELSSEVAKGKKNADDLHAHVLQDVARYGLRAFRLNMINNHDKNAWDGTVKERYGEGDKAFAVFSFLAYGVPVIYSGQEAGLDKRLKFFEKDTISWEDPEKYYPFYQKLNQLKEENPALWNGAYGAMPEKLEDGNANVFSFRRTKDNNTVLGIINMTGKDQSINLELTQVPENYKDVFTGKAISGGSVRLAPWEYLVFTAKK